MALRLFRPRTIFRSVFVASKSCRLRHPNRTFSSDLVLAFNSNAQQGSPTCFADLSCRPLPREIEEMPTGLVFSLDDPCVRIKTDFPYNSLLYRLFCYRFLRCRREESLDRPAVVIDCLWCRYIEHRLAV